MPERLQKILAAAGLGSRRECEELIRAGRVSVNGVRAGLGARADPERERIAVDGRPVRTRALLYIALYKPRGCASTRKDPHAAKTIPDLLPASLRHLFPVGRLDVPSEGLILLTNDGELANHLMHPRYQVRRTYRVTVSGNLTDTAVEALRAGIPLEDGLAKAESASVLKRDPGSGRTRLEMVLTEGRNREVRRMFEALGHDVLRLVRVQMGPVTLGALKPGAWRELTQEEIGDLMKLRTAAAKPRAAKDG